MIRHARAAVLAGAVLAAGLAAASPALAEAKWWLITTYTDGATTTQYFVDEATLRETAPGVVQIRALVRVEENGRAYGWAGSVQKYDCARGRMNLGELTFYDGQGVRIEQPTREAEWEPLPYGVPIVRFLCDGDREFDRRADFTPPMDAAPARGAR